MPSFSSTVTSLTGLGFFYEKSSRHATYVYNQDSLSLYRNQPRFPFEFYVDIKLNKVGTTAYYISQYFNNPNWEAVAPLVKSVDMPAFKIETTPLNQYNRKRLSQTKVAYEPIKMVFHDVADGKTLKFWEMYYRYYFKDGNEAGKNEAKMQSTNNGTSPSIEQFIPKLNPAIASLPGAVKDLFGQRPPTGSLMPTDTLGSKQDTQNIIADALTNHNFGFNLQTVGNVRNLIQTIDIYQVHGGRFNQVTLVNPRIAAFTHDILNYSTSDRTLELTFTFEYEYAYYTIQNMKLGGGEPNNTSNIEQFKHGEFLELPALAFNASLLNFIESNNPLLESDNPLLQRVGKNVQSKIGSVVGAAVSDKVVRRVTSSALDGLANISPTPYYPKSAPAISTRPFASAASKLSTAYKDVNRIIGGG